MIALEVLEELPTTVSIRKSALKAYDGDLDSLYDVPRWDGAGESRSRHGHNSHKDHSEHAVMRAKFVRRQVRALFGKD